MGLWKKQSKFTVNITIFVLIENASENSKCLTLSSIIDDSDTCNAIRFTQCKDDLTSNLTSNKENLDKPIEEVDLRITPPIEDSIQSKNTYLSTFKCYIQTFWCYCCILCNISLLLVWKNYGWYKLEPGKIKDLYLAINHHINQAPICVQIYSKYIC